ncbi:hypothetical protein RBA41_14200 [Massilia sp. CCM 9210]|uniref:hypothetical protein n=1 Tax=Massilia scottii TaxID=3057166 RepID=UPI0027969517|nr:hypothetical protein [Massilia sp. CCM 9210]MDQ1814459.1 hypothetical protein [Massilia sp. CCM 9210]
MSTAFDRHQRRRTEADRETAKNNTPVPAQSPRRTTTTNTKKLANTADYHYFHNKKDSANCKADADRIRDECADNEETKKKSADALKNARLSKESGVAPYFIKKIKDTLGKIDAKARETSGYSPNDKNRWMQNHCDGLWQKPGGQKGLEGQEVLNTKDFRESIESDIQSFINDQSKMEKEALEKVFSFADDYMMSHWKDIVDNAQEKALRRAAFFRFPGAATLMARIGTYESLGRLIGNTIGAIVTNDMETQFQALQDNAKVFTDAVEAGRKILTPGGMEDAMASIMAGVAYANPCIKARKCLLVPYKDAGKTATGNGCCPGQTGHHVIPNAMFQAFAPVTETVKTATGTVENTTMKPQGLRKCWKDYKENNALTICLEGTANRVANGTHGLAHSGTEEIVKASRHSPDMPYTKARDKTSKLMAKMFGCNWECIAEQLDDELKKRYSSDKECGTFPKDALVSPHSGRSGGGPDLPMATPTTAPF